MPRDPRRLRWLLTALGVAIAVPAHAAGSGDNTNGRTNAAVKRSGGSPVDAAAPGTLATPAVAAPRAVPSGAHAGAATDGPNSFGATGAGMEGWADDYASAHRGRISRQAYIDELTRRWQAADRSGRGLTPSEVSRL